MEKNDNKLTCHVKYANYICNNFYYTCIMSCNNLVTANKLPLCRHSHIPCTVAMHTIAYKYLISKSHHVTFINKRASRYFLYNQQASRALVSGKTVGWE